MGWSRAAGTGLGAGCGYGPVLTSLLKARLPRRGFMRSFCAGVAVTLLLPLVDWLPVRMQSRCRLSNACTGALLAQAVYKIETAHKLDTFAHSLARPWPVT